MTVHTSAPFPREGEKVHAVIKAVGAVLSISDQRMTVTLPESGVVLLDMPLGALRRIQFDIELDRPATLVIVPLHPDHQPQVLAIPPDQYPSAAAGLVMVGRHLADVTDGVGD